MRSLCGVIILVLKLLITALLPKVLLCEEYVGDGVLCKFKNLHPAADPMNPIVPDFCSLM